MDVLERAKKLSGQEGLEQVFDVAYSRPIKAYAEGGPVVTKYSQDDLEYLARTMYGEAGTEPELGIYGVGHVINNRRKSGNYGGSIKDVVLAKNQFEAWDKGFAQKLINKHPRYQEFVGYARNVLDDKYPDPTNGALNFYNPKLATPAWGKTYKETAVIGNHRFMHPDANYPTPNYEPRMETVGSFLGLQAPKVETIGSFLGLRR
jgi:spore germination cell wall hydrolase CwlJ-like protein